MPSIVTHHIFAKDVYEKLPKKIQEKIDLSNYLVFSQSFDNLFYYKFLTPWKGKEIRKLGNVAQQEKTLEYFKNILEYITTNNLEENKEVISYLFGSINHYALDSICHPFIIYYTGLPEVDKKYLGMHEKMEVNIDAYMYKKKTSEDLKNAKISKFLLPKIPLSTELKNTIDYAFFKTFNQKNMGKIMENSIHTGKFLLKYFVTDTTGIKTLLYKIKDLLSTNSARKYANLSFHVTKINKEYLNENHESWVFPADPTIQRNDSFLELYATAIEEAYSLITNIQKYFDQKISKKELLHLIKDNSYCTGLPLTKKLTSKHFKY